ncbi:MAG: HTTM domain-containing protein [Bacteroidia bacterium]
MANSTKSSSVNRSDKWSYLFRPMPALGLGIFRISFGAIMLWEMLYLVKLDFVPVFLTDPEVHFHYDLLSWLNPLPENLMWLLIVALIACCVLIILGKWYRPAMAVFAIGFTYIFFIDKAYYNNHLYLICLLSGWLIFIDADTSLKIGRKTAPTGDETVPAWMYYVLQAHLVMVYFFGGIAKLNYDWLIRHEPVMTMLDEGFYLHQLLGDSIAIGLLTYGGLVFDLTIGFILLFPKTRWLGVAGVLFFNLSNASLFDDINIFPYFMVLATVLFLDQNWLKEKLYFRKPDPKRKQPKPSVFAPSRRLVLILCIYFGIHLLMPFRHFLYPGNPEWTGQGQRFSWRMKIQTRKTEKLEFQVLDYSRKTIYPVDLSAYKLNRDQITLMAMDPAAMWQFCQFLSDRGKIKLHSKKVGVQANIRVSMNNRPVQQMVDPEINMAETTRSIFRNSTWILPLKDNP